MIALVSKAEIKKYVERYPEYTDCPGTSFVEVLPVLTQEAAKRLRAALKHRNKPRPKAKKP
jgi:hypothetical protein